MISGRTSQWSRREWHLSSIWWDSVTQQYYLRARFYNPVIARFIQEDTYRGDGLNLYAYVGNNPIHYVDPSGYMCEEKGNVYGGTGEAEVTLKYDKRFPKREFERKANALKELGDIGLLYKAQNLVPRDKSITAGYRQDMIKRIWNQYGKTNKEFANKLIHRITKLMQPDHILGLQLGDPDTVNNLNFLDYFKNWHIGTQQIRQQVRDLPVGTKIKIKIDWAELLDE